MHDELLQLMEKFELVYKLENNKSYIAPQLLKVNQPEFEWDYGKNMILRYNYDFLPKGLLPRLIVRLQEYITDQEKVWKEGVIISHNKTKGLVLQVYDKNEILVRIAGVNKKELLTIVTEKIEKIHRSYSRIKFDKLIQCNCSVCLLDENPHFYKFDNLIKRKLNKIKTVECDKSFKNVKVATLLDDSISFGFVISVEDLKENIARGNTLIALEQLESLFKDNNEVIAQIGRIRKVYKDNSLGIVSEDKVRIQENHIRIEVLELIDDLKDQINKYWS